MRDFGLELAGKLGPRGAARWPRLVPFVLGRFIPLAMANTVGIADVASVASIIDDKTLRVESRTLQRTL
jgi:hypothetical protein